MRTITGTHLSTHGKLLYPLKMPTLSLQTHGAQHIEAALTPVECITLIDMLNPLDASRPGIRISDHPALRAPLGPTGMIGRHAAAHLGPNARPVRVLLFDKAPDNNWALGWHQDRTVAVAARHDVPGFGPWTIKDGIPHAAPPQALLDRMCTLRVHLDPVGEDNAPLLIAPGSHRHGRIPESDVAARITQHGQYICRAQTGDIWLYATPILHASEAARTLTRRRVLQIDYSADRLPAPLEWLGI